MRENNQNQLEGELREKYLSTIRRFERGEDISILDVLKSVFRYYFSKPREYFATLITKRLGGK